MAQFENDSDTAEVIERTVFLRPGIHNRRASRELGLRLMMVKYNHGDSLSREFGDLNRRRCSTVDRDQQLRIECLGASLQSFSTQAVTFLHP